MCISQCSIAVVTKPELVLPSLATDPRQSYPKIKTLPREVVFGYNNHWTGTQGDSVLKSFPAYSRRSFPTTRTQNRCVIEKTDNQRVERRDPTPGSRTASRTAALLRTDSFEGLQLLDAADAAWSALRLGRVNSCS